MKDAPRLLTGVALLAVLVFGVLVVISLVWLRPEGLSNFDGRPAGYDVDAARAYLAELPDRGRWIYLGLFRWLDTVFPGLAAVAIGGAIWVQSEAAGVFWRVVMLGVVGAYLLMDLSENAAVAGMLRSEVPVTGDMVGRASVFTQLKWAFLAASLAVLAGLWRRNRRMAG